MIYSNSIVNPAKRDGLLHRSYAKPVAFKAFYAAFFTHCNGRYCRCNSDTSANDDNVIALPDITPQCRG